MVARIVCGKNIKGLVLYNENKVQDVKAELIHACKFGLDVSQLTLDEKVKRFQKLQVLNRRVKTNAMHISLNFDPKDHLNKDKLVAIASGYMERLGFGDQPYLVYEHKDVAHPHIHIVTTNIDKTGRRLNLHNIGKLKSEPARKELEDEFNLIKADNRQLDQAVVKSIEPAVYGKDQTRETISNIVREVARSYKYASLPEFNAALKRYNIIADRGIEGTAMFKQGGLAYSIIEKNGRKVGVPIKASRLSGRPTLKFLEQQFTLNKLLRKRHVPEFRGRVDHALKSQPRNLRELSKLLSKENIELIIRENKEGRVYGLTYVDHTSRCVVNGRDLGKRFTANGVLAVLAKPADACNKKQRSLPVSWKEPQNFTQRDHVEAQLPSWILQVTKPEQMQVNASDMSNRRRRRKKKRGRSI